MRAAFARRALQLRSCHVGGGRSKARGLNLVADRTGDTVGRGCVFWMLRVKRQPLEDLGLAVLGLILQILQRHVATGAIVLDGGARFGMLQNLTAHAALPVGVARGVGHDACAPL